VQHDKLSSKFTFRGPSDSREQYLKEIVEALDQVHNGKGLMGVVVDSAVSFPGNETAESEIHGRHLSQGEDTPRIEMSMSSNLAGIYFLHEIGHHIDFCNAVRNDHATDDLGRYPKFQAWYNAVQITPEVRKIQALLSIREDALKQAKSEQNRNESNEEKLKMHIDGLNYLLSKRELFARTYCQYTLSSINHPRIREEYDNRTKQLSPNSFYEFWEKANFIDVENAICEIVNKN
jgi:hypothetical protein